MFGYFRKLNKEALKKTLIYREKSDIFIQPLRLVLFIFRIESAIRQCENFAVFLTMEEETLHKNRQLTLTY